MHNLRIVVSYVILHKTDKYRYKSLADKLVIFV